MTRLAILAALLLLAGCASPMPPDQWAVSGCMGDGVQSADGPAPRGCPAEPKGVNDAPY